MKPVPLAPFLALLGILTLPAAVHGWEGVVTAVADGDVIEVAGPEGTRTVRLAGVAAPRGRQDYAKLSRRFTSQAALKVQVRVEETGCEGGVLVARVILPRGQSLAEELVRAGMAWWDRVNHPDLEVLAGLERSARESAAGLWFDDRPVAPWEWRAPSPAAAEPLASGDSAAPASAAIPVIQPLRIR